MKFSSIGYVLTIFLAATGLLAMAWGNIQAADKIVRLGFPERWCRATAMAGAVGIPPHFEGTWVD